MASETIALFGATGKTGCEVLLSALDAGYKVRIMVRTPSKVEIEHPNLTVIKGDFASIKAVKDTVSNADYVISVAGGPMGKPKDYPVGMILGFVKNLVEIMKETPSVKVFLFQSGAFANMADGTNPVSMKIMRKVVGEWLAGIGPNLDENENIHRYLESIQGEIKFKTITTRPGGLAKGKGGTKLAAVTSPTLGFCTFKDLGRFTIEAIKDESLYGTFPFVGPAPAPSTGNSSTLVVALALIVGAAGYYWKTM